MMISSMEALPQQMAQLIEVADHFVAFGVVRSVSGKLDESLEHPSQAAMLEDLPPHCVAYVAGARE